MKPSTASKLHKRLLALGCTVDVPKRIWLGKASDNGDLWRWEASERVSGHLNGMTIGCEHSMAQCLEMSDDRLKIFLAHSSGNGVFYRDYSSLAAAVKRLKDKQ